MSRAGRAVGAAGSAQANYQSGRPSSVQKEIRPTLHLRANRRMIPDRWPENPIISQGRGVWLLCPARSSFSSFCLARAARSGSRVDLERIHFRFRDARAQKAHDVFPPEIFRAAGFRLGTIPTGAGRERIQIGPFIGGNRVHLHSPASILHDIHCRKLILIGKHGRGLPFPAGDGGVW